MPSMAEQHENTPASWDTTAVQQGELSQAKIHPTELLAPKASSGLAHALSTAGFSSEKNLWELKTNRKQH